MVRSALLSFVAASFALVVLVSSVHAGNDADLKTGSFDPPRAAPDFTLRGSNGAPLELKKYRGKVVALGFGYTSCPDICPTTLFTLAQAHEKLGAQRNDFQVVYVTVDPARDSVDRLKEYLTGFDPTFLGATGDPGYLAEVRKAYGIEVKRHDLANGDYLMHHSAFVYLIDRAGKLRAAMPYGVTADDVAHDVKALLAS